MACQAISGAENAKQFILNSAASAIPLMHFDLFVKDKNSSALKSS